MLLPYAKKYNMPGFLSSFLRLQTAAASDVTHEWMGCPTGGIGVDSGLPRQNVRSQCHAAELPSVRSDRSTFHPHTWVLSLKPFAA